VSTGGAREGGGGVTQQVSLSAAQRPGQALTNEICRGGICRGWQCFSEQTMFHSNPLSPPPRAFLPSCPRFDGLSGSTPDGMPRVDVAPEVLDSIRKNGVSGWGGGDGEESMATVGMLL
jgi:hypothetical protein